MDWEGDDDESKNRDDVDLKVAIIDVKSGQWEMFSPDAIENDAASEMYTRKSADQGQVAYLKTRAYEALAEDVVKRYAK